MMTDITFFGKILQILSFFPFSIFSSFPSEDIKDGILSFPAGFNKLAKHLPGLFAY